MATPYLLLVDNNVDVLNTRKALLEQVGYPVLTAESYQEAKQRLATRRVCLAVIDIRLEDDQDEGDMSGIMLARELSSIIPCIMLTQFGSVEYVRESLRTHFPQNAAAIDFIAKQEPVHVFLSAVRKALNHPKRFKIFLVHGHDEGAKNTVARYLEQRGPHVVILHEQPNAGRTIIEKFEQYAEDLDLAVVLLTPDDLGRAQEDDRLQPRARQNVVYELGYLMAKLGRAKVIPLYKAGVEIPSELAGLLPVVLDEHEGWQGKLTQEIQHAGISLFPEKRTP